MGFRAGDEERLFLFFITLGLELSDTKVYEPSIRALFGTASHFVGPWVHGAVPPMQGYLAHKKHPPR